MSQAGAANDGGVSPGLIVETLTGNSGGAVGPTGNNINTVGTGSITVVGNPGTSTLTSQLTGLTNHNVLVGAGSATITNVAPGVAGTILTSNGVAADPSFQSASASGAIITITGNSGGAESPLAGNFNIVGTGSITTVGTANTETVQLTGLTNHNVLIGAGTATITNVSPSATSGVPLISQGAAADPAFGTAVVAGGGTGVITMTTAYAPVCAGTTATGPLQVASTGLATSGYVLTSNGNAALPSWQDNSVLVATITPVSTSPYVVLSTDYFLSVNTGIAITIRLPNAPATGRMYVVKDATGGAAANNITVTTVGGVVLIDAAATYAINQNYGSIQLIFNGTNYEVF